MRGKHIVGVLDGAFDPAVALGAAWEACGGLGWSVLTTGDCTRQGDANISNISCVVYFLAFKALSALREGLFAAMSP